MAGNSWDARTLRFLSSRLGGPIQLGSTEARDGRTVSRVLLSDGRSAVVKVDTVAERHHREAAGLRAARLGGAPVPETLYTGQDGRWYLVMAEVPTRRSLHRGSSEWRQAGAAAARLHAVPVPAGMRMFCEGDNDWVEHMLYRVGVESAAAVERSLMTAGEAGEVVRHARRVFAEAGPGQQALLHGDLQARHVLDHAGKLTLIDFGDAGWGDPVLDLVVLSQWSPDRLGEVLDGYGANDELRSRVGMLWTIYSLWRHLFVSRWYYNNAPERLRNAEAARRLLQEQVLHGGEMAEPISIGTPIDLECDVVLVDFDGLLVDTEFAGWRSWSELYVQQGSTLPVQDYARNTGSNAPLSPWGGLDQAAGAPVDRIVMEAGRRVRRDSMMTVMPGVREFLAECRAVGIRLGLVSNSPQRWIDRQSRNLDLDLGLFDVVVPGDEHPPKPAPNSYRHALELLCATPKQTFAIEDSDRGVAGAKAAGLRCVAVPNRVTVHTDLSHADHIVPSLAQLRPIPVRAHTGAPS